MTLEDIFTIAGQHTGLISIILLAIPFVAWLPGLMHGRGNGGKKPWSIFYGFLVYMACLPGIFAAVLTTYSVLFLGKNLLTANITVYFLPIISMVATLAIIRSSVTFDDIPGFDRLSGLMIILAILFILVLGIQKTNIWMVFHGSFSRLLILLVVLFLALQWAGKRLFGKKRP